MMTARLKAAGRFLNFSEICSLIEGAVDSGIGLVLGEVVRFVKT